ncbi:NADH-quinone oxidoreductase subunit C [Pseudodesulfovibrio karagichevae]|uniref:NADH-quinone oxidoreductase subunit C n=1 Tax=Pseudodesulfovibrio karagichevae TaxID=3239305 RepID=A0ABV4JWW9_9BACT
MTTNKQRASFNDILTGMDIAITSDSNGNQFGWTYVTSAQALRQASLSLANNGARLCTITAFNEDKFAEGSDMELVYNFDLDGAVLSLCIRLTPEACTIPSIVDHFPNADWHEREFAELFDIELTGREKPERLFLDPCIDTGIFHRLIPLSSMMNGATTKQLWETIFAETAMPDWAKEAK